MAVLEVEREMEFFDTPAFPELVPVVRPEKVFPVLLTGLDRDVERIAWDEEKLFPTFRIFDLARTLDAFWLVKLFR